MDGAKFEVNQKNHKVIMLLKWKVVIKLPSSSTFLQCGRIYISS